MLCVVVHLEDDGDLWIERINSERAEVRFNVEHETIDSGRQRFLDQKERLDSPVFIGPCVAQLCPTLVGVLSLEADRDALGRRTSRRVENVCGDGAHNGFRSLDFGLGPFCMEIREVTAKTPQPKTQDLRPKTCSHKFPQPQLRNLRLLSSGGAYFFSRLIL